MDGLSHYGIFFRIIAPLSTAIAVTLAVAFFVANRNSYLLLRVKGSKRRYTSSSISISMAPSQGGRAERSWLRFCRSGNQGTQGGGSKAGAGQRVTRGRALSVPHPLQAEIGLPAMASN